MRINFDFLDLEVFLALFETRSFHRAAEQLAMSQTSVTRRIQKIEQSLGTQLFIRTTRAVRPTLAAKRFSLRAEEVLQDMRETLHAMRDETAAFDHQRAQTLTIAALPTVIAGVVAPAVARLRADQSAARVRIIDVAANEVAEAVAAGEADLGIGSIPMLEPTTEFAPLLNDMIGLALPEGHELAARSTIPWSAVQSERLILPARGTGNRLLIDEALASGGAPLRWSMEVGRTTTAIELVAAGLGVGPLPSLSMPQGEMREICWRPLSGPAVSRQIGLITRIGQADTKLSLLFKKILTDQHLRG